MAFYSVRIDDEGKEIETTRQTYRKFFNDACGDAGSIKASDRDNFQTRKTCRSPVSTFKTVRYVNPATFIEKDVDPVKKPQLSNREEERNESDEINSDTFDFSVDVNEQQYQSHIATESIPSLGLNSKESFPSSNNLTYSYRRVCEVTKIIQKPDAYREWLEAKRTAFIYERDLKKKRQAKEEEEKQKRKRLAEEKFNEWLLRKTEPKTAKLKILSVPAKNEPETNEMLSFTTKNEGTESNFKAWLESKKQKEKAQKKLIAEELKREQELITRRKQESAHIYEDWLKTAPQRPKPVPLNQGMFTLKGSISEIYVNPVPWVSVNPDDNSKSMKENTYGF